MSLSWIWKHCVQDRSNRVWVSCGHVIWPAITLAGSSGAESEINMAGKPTKEGEKIIDFLQYPCIYHFCLILFEIHFVLLIVPPFRAETSSSSTVWSVNEANTFPRLESLKLILSYSKQLITNRFINLTFVKKKMVKTFSFNFLVKTKLTKRKVFVRLFNFRKCWKILLWS